MSTTQANSTGTQLPTLFAELAASFDPNEVRTRTQGGRQLNYITARTAMNRLDEVLGPENWWDDYTPGENSVLCRLTIRLPDGSTVTKADAGGYAGMSDHGDDDKSGYSDAFKRAAVKFGVGRYLYNDGVPGFVREHYQDATHEPQHQAPQAAPQRPTQTNGHTPQQRQDSPQNGSGGRGIPTSGRALFAWTKEQEEKHGFGLLKYLNAWSKLQDFPGRMVDLNTEQVALAYAEGCHKLDAIQSQGGDSGEY